MAAADRPRVASRVQALVESLEVRVLLAADPVNTFQPPLPIPELGTVGQLVAKGDFNGDGLLDLAVTGGTATTATGQNGAFDGGVQVMLNDGTGQFTPAGSLQTLPFAPTGIVTGDFDGDGADDVAVAGGAAGAVSNGTSFQIGPLDGGVFVLMGDGAGGLRAPVHYLVNDGGTNSLVVGDFNGDRRVDIAASGFRRTGINATTGVMTSESQISVLRNAGDGIFVPLGTFFPAVETHLAGSNALSIAPIALDTDRLTDLAVSGTGLIQFLRSKGDGTFDFADSLSGNGFVTSADLNGDGLLDLIGTTGSGGAVQYALARSGGGFDDLVTVAGTGIGSASGLALGDFNGDGRIDFLNGADPQTTGGLFLQQADGSFLETPSTGIGQPVLTGDFNNDGRDDAVTPNQIYLATPPAVFTSSDRTLVITGTRRADTVAVTVNGSRIAVTLDGQTVTARVSRVRRIHVTTGLGADSITIDASVFAPALVSAGGSGDTVVGGSGDDTIQGDNNSDVLSGGAGIDLIQGGKGADTIDGGPGADAIFGGRETDTYSSGDALTELLDRTLDEPIV
jgi:hypothetical protein